MKKLNKTAKIVIAVALVIAVCVPVGIVIGRCTIGKKADIVVTMFPQYDWVKRIIGKNPADFTVRYLLSNGIDPHNYNPSVQDAAAIIDSKLFIYTGEADVRIEKILNQNPRKKRREIAMMDIVETKALEFDHDEEDCDGDCFHPEDMDDEHVWLSLKMARLIIAEIAETLADMDKKNAEYYMTNAENYIERLRRLDQDYEDAVEQARQRLGRNPRVLFADRFPFLYLMDDDYIEWDAAFGGCAIASQITFDTRIRLNGVIDTWDLGAILILERSNNRSVANIMVNEAKGRGRDLRIRVLNSMQSVTGAQSETARYYTIMRRNLEVLKEAMA